MNDRPEFDLGAALRARKSTPKQPPRGKERPAPYRAPGQPEGDRVRPTGSGGQVPPRQSVYRASAAAPQQKNAARPRPAAVQPQPAAQPVRPRAAVPEEDGWLPPPQPNRGPTPEQRRAAARRARERRRQQRKLRLAGTVAAVLVLSGIITLLLPKDQDPDEVPAPPVQDGINQLVAPLPYAGRGDTQAETAPALDWGVVGPQLQTAEAGFIYTAAPAAPAAMPEFGRVTTEWFADAAFLGDSLTAGFCANEYGIDVGGALICGYEGTSPNQVVNRTALKNPDRGEEVPLDVLAAQQPAKLYVLMGTNALVALGNDEGFLNYYAKMLDDLRAVLPHTAFYVQSILPVRPEAAEKLPGLAKDRVASINAALQQICAERGMYFLDLNREFSDENGDLIAEYAQPDGIHLKVSGYNKWVSFLCTHTPYDKDNPYQAGSTYYLDDSLKQLLADLP